MRPRYFIALLAVLIVAAVSAVRPRTEGATYYIQLVRACHDHTPPAPNSKRVGPRLMAKFQSPFKWQEYWEMDRQEVALVPGHSTRVRLGRNYDVLIDLTDEGHRKVTAFQNHLIIEKLCAPRSGGMTVIGGDRDERTSWFIVVRRDQPSLAVN